MANSIESALPSTCTVVVPGPDFDPQVLCRWSDVLVGRPHAIVTPSNTTDIIATIEYAAKHKLKVIPSGGARGSYVPITDHVVYLDMKNFDSFELDEEKMVVQFGGACMSGALLKGLAKKGYYTAGPNSNGVGMTGSLLGGLNHPLRGKHGMGVDMLRSLTIVPFGAPSGGALKSITLSRESQGDEQRLFRALRGAGHGLGVVISATLEVHRLADLNLEAGDKVWQRTLIFPPNALSVAVEAYLSLSAKMSPEMSFFLGFMRAPPNAPFPGAPVILLSTSFFGPSSAAEVAAAPTFSESAVAAAVNASTALVPFADIHNALDPVNKPGGYKKLHGAFLREISALGIEQAFAAYQSFTEGHPSRFGSAVLLVAFDPQESQAQGVKASTSGFDFVNIRNRGVYVQVKTSYGEAGDETEANTFANKLYDVTRQEDRKAGWGDRSFGNSWVAGMRVDEVYGEAQVYEIEAVRKVWDSNGVGWAPIDGMLGCSK